MRGHAPVPAVQLRPQPQRGQRGCVRGLGGVAVAVRLGAPPVDEGVAVVAAEQLGHRDHGHVLLEAEVGIHHPRPLASDVENYLGGPLLEAALGTGMFLQDLR